MSNLTLPPPGATHVINFTNDSTGVRAGVEAGSTGALHLYRQSGGSAPAGYWGVWANGAGYRVYGDTSGFSSTAQAESKIDKFGTVA